jgi:hypothetical protein
MMNNLSMTFLPGELEQKNIYTAGKAFIRITLQSTGKVSKTDSPVLGAVPAAANIARLPELLGKGEPQQS